jgi:uncharacterized protein with PIN domain
VKDLAEWERTMAKCPKCKEEIQKPKKEWYYAQRTIPRDSAASTSARACQLPRNLLVSNVPKEEKMKLPKFRTDL